MDRPIRYCPYCGVAVEMRMIFGKERYVCPACGWVYYTDPKVAVAVLVEQDGKVLLTRRVNEPLSGLWTLPAGFMDAYEDPERAAERECLEETGLRVETTGLVEILAGREHPRGSDILIVYRAKIVDGSLAAGDDADQVGFFHRDQLPPLAFQSTRKILGLGT
ncbi:MAG: NUDIX hydrolase [Chloroflexi bacterium]|nr:NUDIX hydrolase [Chloroflexota bacterium]